MSTPVLLLILRLVSAALLLAFLCFAAYTIYRDVRLTTGAITREQRDQGYITALNPESTGSAVRYPLLPITSIGRSATNTIVLEDNYISGEHALLARRGQQWWLHDLNSRNGTRLNGIMITEAVVVSPGDIITVGEIDLKMEAD
jgi:hypothetical protein